MKKAWVWSAAVITALLGVGAVSPPKVSAATVAFSAGNGTVNHPFIIDTSYQLQQLAMLVNSNSQDPETGQLYGQASYELGANLDLTEMGNWTPIGESVAFTGTFNGAGHTITGLTMTTAPSGGNSGLFGVVSGATIQNVGLVNTDIAAGVNVGALVGLVSPGYTDIADTFENGTVATSGTLSSTGGLVGTVAGTLAISNTYTAGSVSGTGSQASVGGVAGTTDANVSITNTYSASTVQNTTTDGRVGGLIGSGTANVTSSFYLQGQGGGDGTAEPMAALRTQNTFASWDFTDIWQMGTGATPSLIGFDHAPSLPLTQSSIYLATPYSVSLGGGTGTGAGTSPFTWSVVSGAIPYGLTLAADGTISGESFNPGIYHAQLQLADGEETLATESVTYDVFAWQAPPLTILSELLPNALVGLPYRSQLMAYFGEPPYQWRMVSGTLPSGLTMNSSGVLVGTPTGPDSTSSFTVQVTDAGNTVAQSTFSVTVSGVGVPHIATTSLPIGTVGNPYQSLLSVSGGAAPLQWMLLSGTLPPGLVLAGDGTISGTPKASGSYPISVEVMDANGVIDIRFLTLTVSVAAK